MLKTLGGEGMSEEISEVNMNEFDPKNQQMEVEKPSLFEAEQPEPNFEANMFFETDKKIKTEDNMDLQGIDDLGARFADDKDYNQKEPSDDNLSELFDC